MCVKISRRPDFVMPLLLVCACCGPTPHAWPNRAPVRSPIERRMPARSTRFASPLLLSKQTPPLGIESPSKNHHGWIWAARRLVGAIATLDHSEYNLRPHLQFRWYDRNRPGDLNA